MVSILVLLTLTYLSILNIFSAATNCFEIKENRVDCNGRVPLVLTSRENEQDNPKIQGLKTYHAWGDFKMRAERI